MLLVAMLLWMDNTTPGEAMAQEIMAVTHNVSSGEFRIVSAVMNLYNSCTGTSPRPHAA
jgi:hypothetical protein